MAIEHWLAFVVASAVLVAIPGPTILLVISYALGHGRRFALATVTGVTLGDFTAMTASMLGLGALLTASASTFTILKWIGAAYLVYLGIKLWRAPVSQSWDDAATGGELHGSSRRVLLHTYLVTALNPKSIVFFVAFLPQFVDAAMPIVPQMAIFEATFLMLAAINASCYALMATMARNSIGKPAVQRIVNRTGGSLLIGAGILTVGWRKATA